MALTERQVYLLNFLSMQSEDTMTHSVGGDVGQCIDSLASSTKNFENTKHYDVLMEMRNDPVLSKMTIEKATEMRTADDPSGALVVIVAGDTGDGTTEAVVSFEGSQSAADWKDDFKMASMSETPHQKEVLDFYNSTNSEHTGVQDILKNYDIVTTTGHSKGGNHANYVALLGEGKSVDRAITFDAPGFSDEFIQKHAAEIAAKQNSMDNYSAHNDYVNILLNSVGQQHYIQMKMPDGYMNMEDHSDFPEPLLAHEPTMMQDFFLHGGQEVAQDPALAAMDRMLNSYLRSTDLEKSKAATLALGEFVSSLLCPGQNSQDILTILQQGNNSAALADMVGFIGMYVVNNPGETELIRGFISSLDPAYTKILDVAIFIIENDFLLGALGFLADSALLDILFKQFDIPKEYLDFARQIIKSLKQRMKDGKIANGEDKKVASSHAHGGGGISFASGGGYLGAAVTGKGKIRLDTSVLEALASQCRSLSSELQSCKAAVAKCASQCDDINFRMSVSLSLRQVDKGGLTTFGTPEIILNSISKILTSSCELVEEIRCNINRAVQEIESSEHSVTGWFNEAQSGTSIYGS